MLRNVPSRYYPLAMVEMSTRLAGMNLVEARELLRPLEQDSRVLAVAVFGSVARREAGPRSDLDVLVVHDGPMPDDLDDLVTENVTMAFYTPARLAALPTRSPLFATHLTLEGVTLHDEHGALMRTLQSVRPLDARTLSRLLSSTCRRFDELLDQPRGLALNPQAAGAELYALAKQGAMLLGAADRINDFNRHRALHHAYTRGGLSPAERNLIDGLEEPWHAARSAWYDSPNPEHLDAAATVVRRLLTTNSR
jgi:predicted nucleotidyltransferase